MQRFGEKLRKLRLKYGLSYRQLGAELEIAFTHLANIENGSKYPSPDLIIRIADYFEVSTDRLMRDELDV
jgi:transcriptional regulator with XRE-family HTH domain